MTALVCRTWQWRQLRFPIACRHEEQASWYNIVYTTQLWFACCKDRDSGRTGRTHTNLITAVSYSWRVQQMPRRPCNQIDTQDCFCSRHFTSLQGVHCCSLHVGFSTMQSLSQLHQQNCIRSSGRSVSSCSLTAPRAWARCRHPFVGHGRHLQHAVSDGSHSRHAICECTFFRPGT